MQTCTIPRRHFSSSCLTGAYDRRYCVVYRYAFNGKEDDPETGYQDYGMRQYDPRLCRFFSVDPIADQYPELTPYQFASNTPIQAIDLDGLEALTQSHRVFINEIGFKLFRAYRSEYAEAKNRETNSIVHKKAWSIKGSLFALSLSVLESDFANEERFRARSLGMNNYWGMGDSGDKRIRYKSFKQGYEDWIHDMSTRWPDAVKLMESGEFTNDQMNRALNSHKYMKYPAYNFDIENGQYIDYAAKISSIMQNLAKRMVLVIDENIKQINESLKQQPLSPERIAYLKTKIVTNELSGTKTYLMTDSEREVMINVENLENQKQEYEDIKKEVQTIINN
jgi:RHS repeat-associated protein